LPLSAEKIAELVKKRDAPKPSRTGRKKFNVNDRSYQAWFALEHHLLAEDGKSMAFCDNPDCLDPRDKTYGQTVVDINGQHLCRFCFLNGWLTTSSGQEELSTDAA